MEIDFITLTHILSAAKCFYENILMNEEALEKAKEMGEYILNSKEYDFILIEKPF